MKLTPFPEQNMVIAKDSKEYDEMPALHTRDKHGTMFVCWKMSWSERFVALCTGKIWHTMLTFNDNITPVAMSVTKPFKVASAVPKPTLLQRLKNKFKRS